MYFFKLRNSHVAVCLSQIKSNDVRSKFWLIYKSYIISKDFFKSCHFKRRTQRIMKYFLYPSLFLSTLFSLDLKYPSSNHSPLFFSLSTNFSHDPTPHHILISYLTWESVGDPITSNINCNWWTKFFPGNRGFLRFEIVKLD